MGTAEASASAATRSVSSGRVSAKCTKGWYTRTRPRVIGLANSGATRVLKRTARRAGATVRLTSAAERITSVLVRASGRSSRPVSPVNASTGRKLSAAISSETRMAGAKDPAAPAIRACRSVAGMPGSRVSSRRWQASSATTSASTAIPSAMPIPPRLMMVAGNPRSHIAAEVIKRTSGNVKSGASALRGWSRKTRITSTTTATSSASARNSVRWIRSIRSERS